MSRTQHAHSHTASTQTPAARTPALRAATATGGQALDRPTQARMSARFGHDFSQVRVHTDTEAAWSAEAAGAHAFAHGTDVVFGAGHWTPGSPETERLLAHELTHVVQQERHGPGDPTRASDRGDASEQEAERVAADIAAGRDAQVEARPGAAIARGGGYLPEKYCPTWGDYHLCPGVVNSTDSTHDQQPGQQQANDRARQQQEDADEAKRRGEKDPRAEWWKGPPFAPPALTPLPPGLTPLPGQYPTPGPVDGGPGPLPGLPDWTPPTFPNLAPPPTVGPQLTPPTFDPFPHPKPSLLGGDGPQLHLDPIPGLTPGLTPGMPLPPMQLTPPSLLAPPDADSQ